MAFGLQRSQTNVGKQSSRKSKPSQTLAPPSGTYEYPVSAVPTHVQTTFLRGQRAAEFYLALSPALRFRVPIPPLAPICWTGQAAIASLATAQGDVITRVVSLQVPLPIQRWPHLTSGFARPRTSVVFTGPK